MHNNHHNKIKLNNIQTTTSRRKKKTNLRSTHAMVNENRGEHDIGKDSKQS